MLTAPIRGYSTVNAIYNRKDILVPASIYILIVSALLCNVAVYLYQHFPTSYTWEELFINYEGGFIRRGLVGQILLLVDSALPMPIFYVTLFSAIFMVFLYISYKKLTNVFDPIVVQFIFISPVIFLLHINDKIFFGRKDLFIEIILLCIAQSCINCLEKKHIYKSTLLISILFIMGMLIHEMIIFYFPIFAVLLGVAYARQEKIFQWLFITGVLFSVTLLLGLVFSGNACMSKAICASWALRYPELTCKGAISYLSVPLYGYVTDTSLHHTNWVSMGSVFLGLVLSSIPMIFLWKAYRPYTAVQSLLSNSRVLRLAFWPAVFAPFVISVIANDFGRHISTAFLSYIFFLYAVFSVQPQPAAPWLHKLKKKISVPSRLRYAYLCAFVYGLCWRMTHWQPVGESYVQPGEVLRFFYHKLGLFVIFP